MNKLKMDCGCEFNILDEKIKNSDNLPSLEFDIYNPNENCKKTWELFKTGRTKGVFQLETYLGQHWSKQIQPDSIEDISAIISLIRPGCISYDTKILTKISQDKTNKRKYHNTNTTIEKIYKNKDKFKTIISYNEETGTLQKNKVLDVIFSETKDVFKVTFKRGKRQLKMSYGLKCTDDHLLLTLSGWKALKDIEIGERFAALKRRKTTKRQVKHFKNEKSFRDIYFKNYHYKCIFCDWNEASLDVNHIDGNRKTNNNPENLCFMCPNHHKMYSEGLLTKSFVIDAQQKNLLPLKEDIEWVEFTGKEYIETCKVYDISLEAPHHNFIAGGVVVHNCLKAVIDGKSLTQHFADRKRGDEETVIFDESIKDILEKTFQILTYQEQTLLIVRKIGGFDLKEADILRRAMGKKDAALMSEVETKFIEGCKKVGLVNEEKAKEIWSWIRKSERYNFNKAHSISYSKTAYQTAYLKAHFPLHFYTAWLGLAKEKIKPQEEIQQLVADAKSFNVPINRPAIELIHNGEDFILHNNEVYFGVRNIKRVGDAAVKKLKFLISRVEQDLNKNIEKFSWFEFLTLIAPNVTKTAINNLIMAGALDVFDKSRRLMLHEFNIFSELSEKEMKFLLNNSITKSFESLNDALVDLLKYDRLTTKRSEIIRSLILTLNNPPSPLKDTASWINKTEEDLLGVPLTCSKLDGLNTIGSDTNCKEIADGKTSDSILSVEIKEVKETTVKKGKTLGQKMAFIKVGDESGDLENCVAFCKEWQEFNNLLYKHNTVLIYGQRTKQGSFMIKTAKQI